MIQIFIDPLLEVFELSKVDNKAVFIGFVTSKSQYDCPVVSMDERAVAIMVVLAVGERNVAIGFFTSQHGK